MNTLDDKLLGLEDTKKAIRDAIIYKGVDVPTPTTFREYADKIMEIEGGGGGDNPIFYLDFGEFIKSLNISNDANPVVKNKNIAVSGDTRVASYVPGVPDYPQTQDFVLENNGLGTMPNVIRGKCDPWNQKYNYYIEQYGGLESLNNNLKSITFENIRIRKVGALKGNSSTFNKFSGNRYSAESSTKVNPPTAVCNLSNVSITGTAIEGLLADAISTHHSKFGSSGRNYSEHSGIFHTFNIDTLIVSNNSYGRWFSQTYYRGDEGSSAVTLNLSNLDTSKKVGDILIGATSLQNITFKNCNGWGRNDERLYYRDANLSRQSCINLFNVLADKNKASEIQLKASVYKSLKAQDIAIASNKGWSVVSV